MKLLMDGESGRERIERGALLGGRRRSKQMPSPGHSFSVACSVS